MKIKAKLTRLVVQELDIVIDAEVNDPEEFGIKTDSKLDQRLFGIDSKLKWKNKSVQDVGDVDFTKADESDKADIILGEKESEENKLPSEYQTNVFNFVIPIKRPVLN